MVRKIMRARVITAAESTKTHCGAKLITGGNLLGLGRSK